MTEHTPTPWTIGKKGFDNGGFPEIPIMAGELCPAVCLSFDKKLKGIPQANAAFIVLACNAHDELVAALKWMLATSNDHPTGIPAIDDNLKADKKNAQEAARAALARAGDRQ